MLNGVVAKVTNAGGVAAPNVSVRLGVLPFNTDDPASARWQELGEPVKHDIPADGAVTPTELSGLRSSPVEHAALG